MAVRKGRSCDAHGDNCKGVVKSFEGIVRQVEWNLDALSPPTPVGDAPVDMFYFDACEEGATAVIAALKKESTRRRHRKPVAEATEPEAGA